MFKNKVNLKQIMVLLIFVIFAISCLTLVDSATATYIDPNQESNNENIDSIDEESVEPILTYSTFQNETDDNKNELVKKNIVATAKSSQNDSKTNEKDSTKNIENRNQYENIKVTKVNTAKAGENNSNTSSINEDSVATGNQKVIDPVTENYSMKIEYLEILVVVTLLVASFSSFIIYFKS